MPTKKIGDLRDGCYALETNKNIQNSNSYGNSKFHGKMS